MSRPPYGLRKLLVLVVIAASSSAGRPAIGQQAAPGQSEDRPAPEASDEYAVPGGGPAELAEFIDRVMRRPPRTPEARRKAIAALSEAAEKILAGESSDAQLETAVRVKTMFAESLADLEALRGLLQKADKPKLVRQVRGATFGRRLRDASGGLFQDDENARRQATEKVAELIREIEKFFAEGSLQQSDVSLAFNAGRVAELSADPKLAVEAYTRFAKRFAAGSNEAVASVAKRMRAIVRRLTLVGNTMVVEGTLLGGEPLDWSKYRGKVVLVDFWATWCGPCVFEIPRVKKIYDLYHDLGFEIVGISLDRSREQVEKFVKQREIPWTIVYEEGLNPTAEYYGVTSIPTMILVDKDGTVASIRARGATLRRELERLLGPVEDSQDAAEAAPEDQT